MENTETLPVNWWFDRKVTNERDLRVGEGGFSRLWDGLPDIIEFDINFMNAFDGPFRRTPHAMSSPDCLFAVCPITARVDPMHPFLCSCNGHIPCQICA